MRREQFQTNIDDLDYSALHNSITKEEIEKLYNNKPSTLHAASRIPGIRPTTLILLHQMAKKQRFINNFGRDT